MRYLLFYFLLLSSVLRAQNQDIGGPDGNVNVKGTMRVQNRPPGETTDSVATFSPDGLMRAISGVPRQVISQQEWIYRENQEWTTTENNSTVDEASNDFPCTGSLSIEATAAANGDYIQLQSPGSVDFTKYNYLQFDISSKAKWTSAKQLKVRWLNGTTFTGKVAIINDTSFGFNSALTDTCQTIYIPISTFGDITNSNILRINVSIFNGTTLGYFIDNIRLVNSILPPIFTGTTLTWQQTLINGSDLSRDNNVNGNHTTLNFDSLNYFNVYTDNWTQFTGDVLNGRETMIRFYVRDNPYTFGAFGNATGTNGRFGPILSGYSSGYGGPYSGSAISLRSVASPVNDYIGADAMVTVHVGIASDTTNPLSSTFNQVTNRDIFQIVGTNATHGNDTMFLLKKDGQIRHPHYGQGTFTGTPTYYSAYTSNGSVIERTAAEIVAEGGGTPNLQSVTNVGNVTTKSVYVDSVVGTSDASIHGMRVGNNGVPGGATLVGFEAGNSNTFGWLTAVGYQAAKANTGGNNAAFGNKAMTANTTGVNNTAIGYQSLINNTTGVGNTAIGSVAGNNMITGNYNTSVGNGAITGNGTTGTGVYNTAVGVNSSHSLTTGNYNTSIGALSLYSATTGSKNVALGDSALLTVTTGSNNIGIGYNALTSSATNSHSIALGSGATALSNQLSVGPNITSVRFEGGLPEYADNAAAVSAGLAVGTLYRTGDLLKIVH